MSKLTAADGKLTIDLGHLFEALSLKDRLYVAEILACEPDIVRFVVEQISTGHTENWSYTDHRTLDEARAAFLEKNADDMTRRVVKSALEAKARAEADESRMNRWAWSVYRAAQAAGVRSLPEIPDWIPPSTTDESVAAWLAGNGRPLQAPAPESTKTDEVPF